MALLRRALTLFREGRDWLCSTIEESLTEGAGVCTCEPRDAFAVIDGSTRMSCPKCEDNRRKTSGPPLISTFVNVKKE